MNHRPSIALALLALATITCSPPALSPGSPPRTESPATTASEALRPAPTTSPLAAVPEGQLKQRLAEVTNLKADRLLEQHALPFATALPYEPGKALGLDRIRKSSMAPSPAEEAALAAQGFSISDSKRFPTFTYGYATLYGEHLPLYISADSLLHVVHKSYDKILEKIEMNVLFQDVQATLTSARSRLGAGAAPWLAKEARADLDLFLAVGLGLLEGKSVAPVAGSAQAEIDDLLAKAKASQGKATVGLFGLKREVDFSQMRPRGHYANRPPLTQYFQAMMWFGRTEFRLLETDPMTGEQVLRRRQVEAALGLAELIRDDARKNHERVDHVIGQFVGEHDAMTLADVDRLQKELGPAGAVATMSDEQLTQKLRDGGYGAQRIASQLMVNNRHSTLPLHRSFQLFGQRYTVDAHVFSNVVYDRAGGGSIKRMMPSPLDAAFAALGNDQAASLLGEQLKKFGYAPDLASMRLLVDAHEQAYWDSSLYTLWVSSLRALSPSKDELREPKKHGIFAVAATEAWGRRILNTQLASWAELRHDTLLYAKQSYSGGILCEFPDAYVDPYPAFYGNLARYAERGRQVIALLDKTLPADAMAQARDHFELLKRVATTLEGMAERQRKGQPFTAEQMAFVNDTVVLKTETRGCTSITTSKGWYPKLIMGDPLEFDPTIADVHTQPTEADGSPVGKVLHVATGGVRRMIVTADTCKGPRAYVGLVSSYAEKVTTNYRRLNDQEWAAEIEQASAPPVPWMSALITPQ